MSTMGPLPHPLPYYSFFPRQRNTCLFSFAGEVYSHPPTPSDARQHNTNCRENICVKSCPLCHAIRHILLSWYFHYPAGPPHTPSSAQVPLSSLTLSEALSSPPLLPSRLIGCQCKRVSSLPRIPAPSAVQPAALHTAVPLGALHTRHHRCSSTHCPTSLIPHGALCTSLHPCPL